MPAVHFYVRWPDGCVERCYSPSTTIHDYLEPGEYPLNEFVTLCQQALSAASERVHARFGFYCSSAQDQRQHIESRARRFGEQSDAIVTVIRLEHAS